ncbi:MAG: TIGR00730 family Rossman fold protein, partial [Hyphomicrobiales bacterium]|nr:TIGR00730 family Rossman fold protein [Hyphomicrobiales bacterium]
HMRESGFVRPGLEVKYLVADRIEDALDMILAAAPVEAPQDEEARDIIRRM